MRLSPILSDRRTARFVSRWALVLGLGLAGCLGGCGSGEGTNQGPAQSGARVQTEETKKKARQEEMQKLKAATKEGRFRKDRQGNP